MGYGFYFLPDGRAAGYGVEATCDKRGCKNEINRGLGYLCGDDPHPHNSGDRGCGGYFCGDHLPFLGARGGCTHRQRRLWGVVLSCMESTSDAWGETFCLYRKGHEGLHAFDVEALARA